METCQSFPYGGCEGKNLKNILEWKSDFLFFSKYSIILKNLECVSYFIIILKSQLFSNQRKYFNFISMLQFFNIPITYSKYILRPGLKAALFRTKLHKINCLFSSSGNKNNFLTKTDCDSRCSTDYSIPIQVRNWNISKLWSVLFVAKIILKVVKEFWLCSKLKFSNPIISATWLKKIYNLK